MSFRTADAYHESKMLLSEEDFPSGTKYEPQPMICRGDQVVWGNCCTVAAWRYLVLAPGRTGYSRIHNWLLDSRQHRGVRRRCLVFEVAGVSKKNLHKDLNVPTSIKSPINAKPTSDNEQLITSKASKSPVSFVLPGIGLHLNALARTSKDKPITHKSKAPERKFISRPCSMRPFAPPTVREKQSQKAIDLQQCQDSGNEFQDNQIVIFDASLTPTLGIEESASPKRKRRKAENSADNESCRRCNCKKSKCLKLTPRRSRHKSSRASTTFDLEPFVSDFSFSAILAILAHTRLE
ncbi:Protein tesmin/TSO1-like CXC 3 [Platanthera guangdongensis]|uniref:Protein tesmin/TSO1-like CXC 3 n=1 Tax=Platanthera guangdongensis TaxID=2320717 RepID=A0ABR2MJT0_9ASPA